MQRKKYAEEQIIQVLKEGGRDSSCRSLPQARDE